VDGLIVAGVVVAPLLFALAIQYLGERRGWSGRTIIRRSIIILWLWYSLALGAGAHMDFLGFVVAAAMVGIVVYPMYRLVGWALKDVNERYEQYLAKKRMRSR